VRTIGAQFDEHLARFGDGSRGARRDRAVAMLTAARLPRATELLAQYPHQLSGGMCQRVMIAIALTCNPRLLIADEPTTAVDVTVQAQIPELLDDLKARLGMSMLLITHDMGVVAETSQHVVVMYGGRVAEEADVEALFAELLVATGLRLEEASFLLAFELAALFPEGDAYQSPGLRRFGRYPG